jgi:aspartate kinase
VCSARSGSTKALGTTSLLLRAASQAVRPKRSNCFNGGTSNTQPDYNATVDLLMHEHLQAARTVVVHDAELLKELELEIERDCDWLRAFLAAANVSPFSWSSFLFI